MQRLAAIAATSVSTVLELDEPQIAWNADPELSTNKESATMVMITVRTDEIPKPTLSSTLTAHNDLKILPLLAVEKHLGSSPEGLSQTKATRRLTQNESNEVAEKKTQTLLKILTCFRGIIPR
ncbi:cation-transporting P-type ATPase [Granulosicoccus antarcticus]|uniref:cation-transporting P-type ATPase n=1 Tax=Granulosicoccus antarcticus TaxID=437505 RepID=UPI00197A9EB0|nr:cation-transporting P-type ATPase [Granulosicoccus antarcticus]